MSDDLCDCCRYGRIVLNGMDCNVRVCTACRIKYFDNTTYEKTDNTTMSNDNRSQTMSMTPVVLEFSLNK